MKIAVPDRFAAPLPRKDIVAICIYLNRANGAKATDAAGVDPAMFIDRVADAARMQ